MKIKRIVLAAFLAILGLFAINLSIYFWGNQKRSSSFEYLRASLARQDLEASVRQQLNDLQKQVGLIGEITPDAGTAGLGSAEIAKFNGQLDAVSELTRQLAELSSPEILEATREFSDTWAGLRASWRIVYENFGVNQSRAVTELATRAEPLAAIAFQRLNQLQQNEKRRVETATENFHAIAALTTRVTILIFVLSVLLAVTEAWVVTHALTRIFQEEEQLLSVTTALSSELNLVRLLEKVMETTTLLLNADRSTLFLYDKATGELWSQVAQGLQIKQIRFPGTMGIAGTVFTTGETINIPDAYSDSRFNPEVDRKTGFRTRSILCMPVINKQGERIGVSQVLNKKGGHFTRTDEQRLAAFAAQASIALENAKLFEEVLNMKNYNESILLSLSNGVVTLDAGSRIIKCNDASLRILGLARETVEGRAAAEVFAAESGWVLDTIQTVQRSHRPDFTLDTELVLESGHRVAVNLTVAPLVSVKQETLGAMLVFEDITREKRIRGTMARYLTREVADKLLEGGESVLGGQRQRASVLFSDIRDFTTISERMGSPEAVVSMLNEYFTVMIDVIFHHNGILDKYIGDAIMAVFGVPFTSPDDAENAVAAAVGMMSALRELNGRRLAEGKEELRIGIGINSSDVVSGNIGSMRRMDYTVIGDGVNLASRLEGINKYYGTHILVSQYTLGQLKNVHKMREAGLIRVKGKEQPVAVHEVLDYHDRDSFPRLDEVIGLYAEGMWHYRGQHFADGRERFARAVLLNPKDGLSRIYRDRCDHLLKHPPGESWDGTWVMENK